MRWLVLPQRWQAAPELVLGREVEEELAALKVAGYCAAGMAVGADDVAAVDMACSCYVSAATCCCSASMSMGTGPEDAWVECGGAVDYGSPSYEKSPLPNYSARAQFFAF